MYKEMITPDRTWLAKSGNLCKFAGQKENQPERLRNMKVNFKYPLIILLTLVSSVMSGKDHDCVVISNKVDISIRHQKRFERTEMLIQINSKEGEKAAEFKLYYSPGLKLTKLTAWIQDTAGQVIRKLEKKQIRVKSAFFHSTFYSDYMVKSFDLKYNHFPYQVHVEYYYETCEFLHIADWSPIDDPEVPTLKATLTVEIPIGYPVNILQQKITSPGIDTIDKIIRYTWRGEYIHLIKQETWRPPDDDLCPFVLIVPEQFEYGIKGSFASWQTYGDYIDGLMQDQGILPASEINTVKLLTSGIADTLTMIRKLFHYLQDNTRYIAVAVDIGGMKPYPASYVAQNKFGDCKALSLYMKSLLEVIGVPSFFTLVYGGDQPNAIHSDFPAQRFNHAILCLPYKSDTLWLDCTSKEYPLGYTSSFIQGRPALVVSKGKSKLVNIPFLNSEEVACTHTFHYTALDNESVEVSVHSIYKGPEFEKIAYYCAFGDKEQQRELAKDLLPFSNYELVNYTFTRKSTDAVSIAFDARLKVEGVLKTMEDRIIFTLPAVDIPTFEKIKSREYPVFSPYPTLNYDTIIIAIPAGMAVKLFPATELSCEMGTYKVSSSLDHNNMVIKRNVLIRRGKFGLDLYPDFYNWTVAIRSFERQNKNLFSPIHE